MTNQQLYLFIAVPLLGNAVFFGLLMAYINAKVEGLRAEMNERFNGSNQSVSAQFQSVNVQFQAINQRFDDMRDMWRAELHRVEEVLDARLKHLEER